MKIFVVFGVIIGLLTLELNSLFDDAFGASTPVNVRTENVTGKNLKIYSIIFWDNSWSGKGNYVNYDTELKPNEISNDFWFEIDSTTEFWIVAKDEEGKIEFLKEIPERANQFDFIITRNKDINPKKEQLAQELTYKADKQKQIKRYAIWVNINLIGLLILSLF